MSDSADKGYRSCKEFHSAHRSVHLTEPKVLAFKT